MKRLSLRLPDDLHAALKEVAEEERRSLHSQIIYILETYIEKAETEDRPKGQG
jgi:hypothetical protein